MPHFPDPFTQPDNSTLIIDPSAFMLGPADGLRALEENDEIAVFDVEGTCVGRLVYAGETDTISFPVAAYSPADGSGIQNDELMDFRLWMAAEDNELMGAIPTFEACPDGDALCRDENSFEANVLYRLAQLYTPSPIGVELVSIQERATVSLAWSTPTVDVATLYVLRRPAGADEWTMVEGLPAGEPTGAPRRVQYIDTAAPRQALEYAIEVEYEDGSSTVGPVWSYDLSHTTAAADVAPRQVVQLQLAEQQVVTVYLWNSDLHRVARLYDDVAEAGTTTIPLPSGLAAGTYMAEAVGPDWTATTELTII